MSSKQQRRRQDARPTLPPCSSEGDVVAPVDSCYIENIEFVDEGRQSGGAGAANRREVAAKRRRGGTRYCSEVVDF